MNEAGGLGIPKWKIKMEIFINMFEKAEDWRGRFCCLQPPNWM